MPCLQPLWTLIETLTPIIDVSAYCLFLITLPKSIILKLTFQHHGGCILPDYWKLGKRNRDFLNFAKINSEDFVFSMRVLHQFFASQKKWWHVSRWLTSRCGQKKKPIETSSPSREYCILLIFGSWLHFFPMLGRKQATKQPLLIPMLRVRPYVRNK